MNTFWLIIFMLSMLGGVVAVVLVILSFILSKMRKKRKKYGLFLGGMLVLFLISTFAYAATLSEEERSEMARRQSEQEEMAKTEIIEHTEKTNAEQKQDETESMDIDVETDGISEIDEDEKKEEVNEDFTLVTEEGHPAYYGSTKAAHSIWGKAEKGKVIFADSYDKYSNKTIIVMDGYSQGEKNEVIRGFEIYFKNFSTPMSITLDDALKIADGYIPYEIISKWYEFNGSYCIQPINIDDGEEVYYATYK